MAMKKFFVGVKALIHDEKRGYLILKHALGYWDIPGGRIDDEEEFEETLKREISEELPNTKLVSIGQLAGTKRIHKDLDDNTGLVLLYFFVKAEVPDEIALSEEHTESKWVKELSDMPEYSSSSEAISIINKFL